MLIDRLEELLAKLEEEEEEQKDTSVLSLEAEVSAPPAPGTEMEKILEEKDIPAKAGNLEWATNVKAVAPEGQDEVPEADAAGDETAELLWDELRSVVTGPNGTAVLRRPGRGDAETTELAGTVEKPSVEKELSAVMNTMTAAERGLERLYQQTVQAGRTAAQKLPEEQVGRTVRTEEPGRTAVLTVDELDRAVRRDSRRYDGGMTIF